MFRKMITIVGLIALASAAFAAGPGAVHSSPVAPSAEPSPITTDLGLEIPLFVDPIEFIFATLGGCSDGCNRDRDCWMQAGGVAAGCGGGTINKCFWSTGSGCEGYCACGWA